MAGTVCFALLEFLKTGATGIMFTAYMPHGHLPAPVSATPDIPTSPYTVLIGMALIVLTIWVVRYLWLYIPAAAGFSGREYLRRVGGFMGSVRLLGVWMICSIPVLFLFVLIASSFLAPLQTSQGIPPAIDFIMNSFHVVITMITTLITTAGMSYVIRNMFETRK